ncbi:MAG: hypothetical protein LBG95_03935, partial [Treponema sp.]|nr:hypothetical protein [Treponema sp.]
MKEKWIADFSKPEKSCFLIKPEISFNANLEKSPISKKNALFLGLKRENCMAWLETESRVYVDQIIEAHFRFDSMGGYCAAGIMFRVAEMGTYYLALISSKGYFRLDAVNNNIPKTLIGWTEISGFTECEANLNIIAHSDHLIFSLNGKWIAETNDSSIPGGHLGFALVSYDSSGHPQEEEHSCRAWLDFLSVDSRAGMVRTEYRKWSNNTEISVESRFRLAESLAVLDCLDAAYNQILKIWGQREELARSAMITCFDLRTKKELLFAARMASRLGRYETAEEHINDCLAISAGRSPIQAGAKEQDIFVEKAKILSAQNKYADLAVFLPEFIKLLEAENDHTVMPSLYALLGHACWNLQNYDDAAAAWETAFSLDRNNGLYAANAANAFKMTGNKVKVLQCCLDGAQCFLRQGDYSELGALVPQLLVLGKNNWEAHELAGKWAAGIGDIAKSKAELSLAKELKRIAQVTASVKSRVKSTAADQKTPVKKRSPALEP